ncbi:histidine phosphatase superfamily-domain-containing protein [Lipomyces oligophaga]|uniref:histidine phosphatase superfamily-domain-containing protein n=1 Tax=Lipomyces oligophaga TaxID=45792 RepID=UPI0034CE1E9D
MADRLAHHSPPLSIYDTDQSLPLPQRERVHQPSQTEEGQHCYQPTSKYLLSSSISSLASSSTAEFMSISDLDHSDAPHSSISCLSSTGDQHQIFTKRQQSVQPGSEEIRTMSASSLSKVSSFGASTSSSKSSRSSSPTASSDRMTDSPSRSYFNLTLTKTSSRDSSFNLPPPALGPTFMQGPPTPVEKYGVIGVCAMDSKARSKPCRQILNRLISDGMFETVIFGDKVILDEEIENWPTCDYLISFFSTGFPLDKAIKYANLRKPYLLNDLQSQKLLWDRRLVLDVLDSISVPTPKRLEISRDGGPIVDSVLDKRMQEQGVNIRRGPAPDWKMIDDDTLWVEGETLSKPFVEKPVNGEDHNVYIYYHTSQGGGGRKLFRKVGNKSSEFDASLKFPRTSGSYIYEKFMDTDNYEDVKAYTVGPNFCHAETRKSPVVDGLVRRNTFGKEIRFVTKLTPEEANMAKNIAIAFHQAICGFDLLRVNGKSYVIDVNGFSFVKENQEYYDQCAKMLRSIFIAVRDSQKRMPPSLTLTKPAEQKQQSWKLKGIVYVIRHADRTPKQKLKFSFYSSTFIDLLKEHKEEVIIRGAESLKEVLEATKTAQEEKIEDAGKLTLLAHALDRKMNFAGTKVQIKPVLNGELEVEKVQLILKWGGEPTHSARYQSQDLGDQMRKDTLLMNKRVLENVKVFTSSERRVATSAQIWFASFLDKKEVDPESLIVRKDLLDDSNAAKDLMDKVKKKIKPLLRKGLKPPAQFTWPAKMPEPSVVIQDVVELMNFHSAVMEKNFASRDVNTFQSRWCCGEDPMLFKERWDKLFGEFTTVEKVDPSKISELYDTMKYDALHNRQFLENAFLPPEDDDGERIACARMKSVDAVQKLQQQQQQQPQPQPQPSSKESPLMKGEEFFRKNSNGTGGGMLSDKFQHERFRRLRELYRLTKVLFDYICPQEYGISNDEKLDIGLLTSLPLLKQILADLDCVKKEESGACFAYFTKESHIYTLLNVIYECGIPTKMLRNAIPELDYLTQICFELYESSDGDGSEKQKKYAVRLTLTPGCHCADPLDIQLDSKHCISCMPRRSLTSHLDMDEVSRKFTEHFSRVSLPKRFIPVNISGSISPTTGSEAI